MSSQSGTVGIIGAGTMGAGIAQVACTAGWSVQLMDVDAGIARSAIEGVVARLDRLVEKGRLDQTARDQAAARLTAATDPSSLASCNLIIEAVVEDLSVKTEVLRAVIGHVSPQTIIATNTSSLSVTELGRMLQEPQRTVGMHFFNPVPLMKLVEVIAGDQTDQTVVAAVADIARAWGKQVAIARDVPGFIVNHVARPYYLEAFRILEDGYADAGEIDTAMRELGGFRMGPLELTDLIGQDVNTATTRSVWGQLDEPPLLRPSPVQEQLVLDGHLGRKTGRGVYDYQQEPPTIALTLPHHPLQLDEQERRIVSEFAAGGATGAGTELQEYIFTRIVAAIITQAGIAHDGDVAEATDIDIAMKYGTNYPKGPFQWGDEIGWDVVEAAVEATERRSNEATAG